MRVALLVVTLVGAVACGHGEAPRLPVDEPPGGAWVAAPPPPVEDAAVPPPAMDAAAAADARDDLRFWTGSPPILPTGLPYAATAVVKGVITDAAGYSVRLAFEGAVARGWWGEMWDVTTDRPIPDSGFTIQWVMKHSGGKIGSAFLPRDLAAYGNHRAVRVRVP